MFFFLINREVMTQIKAKKTKFTIEVININKTNRANILHPYFMDTAVKGKRFLNLDKWVNHSKTCESTQQKKLSLFNAP